MNTPSHLIITAALVESAPAGRVVRSAALVGSVAPDVPLYLLSGGAYVYVRHVRGWQSSDAFHYVFDELFFHDPWWIALHNTLHSPLVLLVALACLWHAKGGRQAFLASWWVWFLLSCLLHSLIDIVTHYDDGPLLLFPLDWTTRFSSPVSYWDPRHFGRQFTIFEVSLCLAISGCLLVAHARRWLRPARDQEP